MSVILKYIGICISAGSIIALVIMFAGSSNAGKSNADKALIQNQTKYTSEQYKMYFSFDKGQYQIIDLIKGKTEFNMVYSGESKITARLLHSNGTLLTMLADENGPCKKIQLIEVPETGAYVLDVKTAGEWSLSRK